MNQDNQPAYPHHLRASRFYEAWYFKLNHLKTQSSFWVRFCALCAKKHWRGFTWATFTSLNPDRQISNSHVSDSFEPSFVNTGDVNSLIQVGPNHLGQTSSYGSISADKNISWDLKFTPNENHSFHFAPNWLGKLISGKACTPNINTAFSGKILINGEELICESEPGNQGHYFSKKYAHHWAWAHCNTFEGHEQEVVFEIMDVSLSKALPSLKSAYLFYQGKHYVMNGLCNLLRAPSNYSGESWIFSAQHADLKIEITVTNSIAPVPVEYLDTNDSKLICNNSKLASANLKIFKLGKLVDEFTSKNTTAYEYITRP
jgi:hypothetical protein